MKKKGNKKLLITLGIIATILILGAIFYFTTLQSTLVFADGYTYVHSDKVGINSDEINIGFSVRAGRVTAEIRNYARGENKWDTLPCLQEVEYIEEGIRCDYSSYYGENQAMIGSMKLVDNTIPGQIISNYIDEEGKVFIKGTIDKVRGGRFYSVSISGSEPEVTETTETETETETIETTETEVLEEEKGFNYLLLIIPLVLLSLIGYIIYKVVKKRK